MSIDTSPLDLEDPLSWAKEVETYSDFVREIAPQYGIDVQKYMLGDVLSTITCDDANCLGSSDAAVFGKESLLIRLRWETSLEETPENIREKLKKFIPIVDETNWSDEVDFLRTKEAWYKKVRGFVKHQIALNKSYRDAMNYEFEMENVLHPEYQKILFGNEK